MARWENGHRYACGARQGGGLHAGQRVALRLYLVQRLLQAPAADHLVPQSRSKTRPPHQPHADGSSRTSPRHLCRVNGWRGAMASGGAPSADREPCGSMPKWVRAHRRSACSASEASCAVRVLPMASLTELLSLPGVRGAAPSHPAAGSVLPPGGCAPDSVDGSAAAS